MLPVGRWCEKESSFIAGKGCKSSFPNAGRWAILVQSVTWEHRCLIQRDGSSAVSASLTTNLSMMNDAPDQYWKFSPPRAAAEIERKRAEDALRESEERLARAEKSSLVMVTHADLEGRWLKVPPTLCELLGYSEEELLGGYSKEVTHPDDFEAGWRECQRLIRGEIKSFDLEKRYIHRDGHVVWAYINCSMVTDSKGSPVYFLAYIRTSRIASGPRKRCVRVKR